LSQYLTSREVDVRAYGVVARLLLALAGATLRAQTADPRPAIAVLNLRFDGRFANLLEPGDTAVAAAATSRLLETLKASDRLAVVDSSTVARSVAVREADGNPCDHPCAVGVGRELRARWVVKGTVIKTSNLVWVLTGQLIEVATDREVLSDSYELKGDARRMGPAGAHVFAQRVEKAAGASAAAVAPSP
jgi:TolB-like protein